MTDFIKNKAGAKIYKDLSNHEILKIPAMTSDEDQGVVYHVLSVGMGGTGARIEPLITVKKSNQEVVAYRLPEDLQEWVKDSMRLAMQGIKIFPTDVQFAILNGRTYADML